MSTQKHLWEVEHPYYCNEGNFFARPGSECHSHYRRWQDFVAIQGSDDMDLNLVFRFDWEPPYEDGDREKPIKWAGDENYRDSVLMLFYMGQRKGLYRCVIVDVCRADEPSVRKWLQARWDHMRKLWEPLSE